MSPPLDGPVHEVVAVVTGSHVCRQLSYHLRSLAMIPDFKSLFDGLCLSDMEALHVPEAVRVVSVWMLEDIPVVRTSGNIDLSRDPRPIYNPGQPTSARISVSAGIETDGLCNGAKTIRYWNERNAPPLRSEPHRLTSSVQQQL